MFEKMKTAFAAVLTWIDGNPRKGALAALALGLVVGWVL